MTITMKREAQTGHMAKTHFHTRQVSERTAVHRIGQTGGPCPRGKQQHRGTRKVSWKMAEGPDLGHRSGTRLGRRVEVALSLSLVCTK